MDYRSKKVLITGGLGFLGSNLAIALVKQGADVMLLDAMIPGYGGNLFNIAPVVNEVKINYADIRDEHVMNYLVRDKDYIFHLAGQVSHVLSLSDPFPDIDINIKGTAILLEACKKYNRDAIIVRTGTRGQYGTAKVLPVNEEAPMNPKGIYEISLMTAEKMMNVYHDIHKLRCVMLRITNVYGQRSQMHTSHYGVVNWFIRLALDQQVIKVFGDGSLKRDFLYVDDCIEAILTTAVSERCYGHVFNVGDDKSSSFLELTKIICEVVSGAKWEYAPFTPERAAQEPGDFYSDITKIKTMTGWEPRVNLKEGINRSVQYYIKHKTHYW